MMQHMNAADALAAQQIDPSASVAEDDGVFYVYVPTLNPFYHATGLFPLGIGLSYAEAVANARRYGTEAGFEAAEG
ncbi:MAG: hypothetical protein JWO31_4050 [Phycisphaerales bacterium]|nr:hypothetical protein [Phycisphaerales bacterium]